LNHVILKVPHYYYLRYVHALALAVKLPAMV
jgi:hypothetical protein